SELSLDRSRLVAFGSTRRPRGEVGKDSQLQALLEADTDFICIVGKSWDRHVTEALNVSLEEGLAMVGESIEFLRERGKRVFFDAEHFFDGFRRNPEYALSVLDTAAGAGAERIVLCDTNGGALPSDIAPAVEAVTSRTDTLLGVHFHNDSDCAVANSLTALSLGVHQVQGCVNGYGERTGNADLCSVIPNLTLKSGVDTIPAESLARLYPIAQQIADILGAPIDARRPYVGTSAFAHKGGLHTSGLARLEGAYEHISPSAVGNSARMLFSELMGRATVLSVAQEKGWSIDPETAQGLVDRVKTLEHAGYQFEAADGSFEMLVRRASANHHDLFEVESLSVSIQANSEGNVPAVANLTVAVDGDVVDVSAEGDGPVNAMDEALRKALELTYPEVKRLRLTDYKVRDLDSSDGTAARVRVLIETSNGESSWGTVGVHQNIIEASWQALSEGIMVGLLRDGG
ncbi:MAG TPA: citramalate synthase, partial [Acidimicrobiia bacterium]|nr:citramalate synthase [Acidimicrobiia bacterium]